MLVTWSLQRSFKKLITLFQGWLVQININCLIKPLMYLNSFELDRFWNLFDLNPMLSSHPNKRIFTNRQNKWAHMFLCVLLGNQADLFETTSSQLKDLNVCNQTRERDKSSYPNECVQLFAGRIRPLEIKVINAWLNEDICVKI